MAISKMKLLEIKMKRDMLHEAIQTKDWSMVKVVMNTLTGDLLRLRSHKKAD